MKQYEYLLFDMDDTLINHVENAKYAYKKMVELLGKKFDDIGFQSWYQFDKQFWIEYHNHEIIVPEEYNLNNEMLAKYVRSIRYLRFFNNEISLDKAFEINEIFIKSLNEIVVPIDGAYDLLNILSKKYKIVIATNGPSSAVVSKLGKINCMDFVSYVFSADMTKQIVTKPSKEYFDKLVDYINVNDKTKLLIVGDSLYADVAGGMNSGIDSCWLNLNNETLSDEYKPTMIINNLMELVDKL